MTNETKMMTKTETKERLRRLTQLARKAEGVASNAPVEVGTRNYPVQTDVVPTQRECYGPEGDDLFDIGHWNEVLGETWVRTPGAVVHLYVYERSWTYGQELIGVVVGWMGNGSEEPRLIDVDGKAVSLGRCSFYDCDREATKECGMCSFVLCPDHTGRSGICAGMRHC